MLSLALRTVVLSQDCFQLCRLFGSNRTAFFQFSLVTDDVLCIAFVTLDDCDMMIFPGPLLAVLTFSNCDCFHMGLALNGWLLDWGGEVIRLCQLIFAHRAFADHQYG
jgi:hypothetical protein